VIRTLLVGLVLAGAIAPKDFLRDTNSHAAHRKGMKAWTAQQYGAAVEAFRRAQQLAPSPSGAFNAGSAAIAAGQQEEGARMLEEAIGDSELRADALFNRGNGALSAKALDHAVRDYAEALRANPRHAGAKRNLEIALKRREEQQRRGGGGNRNDQGRQQQQQQQQQPGAGQQRPPAGEVDLEALLRSVQQQEQDELRRMKGRAAEGRVGW
jgi:tetratricopeptide (TPR) repeat protein